MTREAEMDLALRIKLNNLKAQLPSFVLTRLEGGSGFPIAQALRHYFFEYFNRFSKYGPHSLPTSFNVVESFLSFSERFLSFDLREEREHLLRLHEYLDWYTAGKFPDKPRYLTDIIPEGVVYSYNMISPLEDFAIETNDSKLRVLGVGMIRHGPELSAMMVAGETPPFPPDSELADGFMHVERPRGKENIQEDPSFGIKDRYVAELPGHARVVMLARFDLDNSRYDVRYVNLDLGASYMVLTDDPMVFESESDAKKHLAQSKDLLDRYSSLFSGLASMLYLPAFFVDQAVQIIESKFATALYVQSTSTRVRKAKTLFGQAHIPFFRTIRCLTSPPPDPTEAIRTLEPPDMEFRSTGYWRPLGPGEIGETKDGTPVVGKTWVERTDSWTSQSLHSFVVSRTQRPIVGNDPGWIYVMRSGSHSTDIYKIGLTRRSSEVRANELSSATGVPTGFEVLAQWEVGNCTTIEAEIHRRLKPLRVNRRREFFRGNLQHIIGLIQKVLDPANLDIQNAASDITE